MQPPTTTADWLCHFLSLASSSDVEASTSPLRTLTPSKTSTPSSPFSWPDIFHTLHQAYLQNAAKNMRLYHELLPILTLLNENNIPVIVLKGAYLAKTAYCHRSDTIS